MTVISIETGSSPSSEVAICAIFSTSGSDGRISSWISPPLTFTASGTSSPERAFLTEIATAIPARSWASSVDAPRCGVATT